MKWGEFFQKVLWGVFRTPGGRSFFYGLLEIIIITVLIAAPISLLLYFISYHEKLDDDEKLYKFLKIFAVLSGIVFIIILLGTCA